MGEEINLKDLVTTLQQFRFPAVVVTGPQRSGTTIAAHILAQELGYRYVDENEFGIHDFALALGILGEGQVVIQAPALCHMADKLGVPVVMMRRDPGAIRKSEDRIGWRTAYGGANLRAEQYKYDAVFGFALYEAGFSIYAPYVNIAKIKYYCWDTWQKQNCTAFDLDYESMKEHPLWKEARDREGFAPRQWEAENA